MAINLREHLIRLCEVPAHLPRRRGGKKVHPSCVYRWTTIGCRNVYLEYLQIGGTRFTSSEALERFFARLGAANGVTSEAIEQAGKVREVAMEAAEAELSRRPQ